MLLQSKVSALVTFGAGSFLVVLSSEDSYLASSPGAARSIVPLSPAWLGEFSSGLGQVLSVMTVQKHRSH